MYKTNPQKIANDIDRIKDLVKDGRLKDATQWEKDIRFWTLAAIATDCAEDPKECARLCTTTGFIDFKRE